MVENQRKTVGDVPAIRVGIDVGGTFTDFILIDEKQERILTGKCLTTPEQPGLAVVEGLKQLLNESGRSIDEVDGIVHGTTLVTNTVIERKGAKIGVILTEGFRDVPALGREMRYDLYDLFLELPQPLAERPYRQTVRGRVLATGEVMQELDEEDVHRAAGVFRELGVESVAVCLMHSYRNPEHEKRVGVLLAELLPGVPVTLSSDVAPEIREYERANTACVNAYVQPMMEGYLKELLDDLRVLGFQGSLHVMLSGGGIASPDFARRQPVHLIESGPAAGAIAMQHFGRLAGENNVISFDMGGTTAKMCLIEDGEVEHATVFEAARVRRFRKGSGLPLKVPVIDLIEIGAGGGSIAHIDSMELLKVGPYSAGSVPGPVCYGRGGKQPTATDSDLLLGYLSPQYFLGGEMALDNSEIHKVFESALARPLDMSVMEVAAGVHEIINETMAAATRAYVAEKGRDPRNYIMMAFGGAGPVHAYGLARLLKLSKFIVPQGAGVASALGLLAAPPEVDLVSSGLVRLDRVDWGGLSATFNSMREEARRMLREAGAQAAGLRFSFSADMRYAGQGFEIPVLLDAEATSLNGDEVRSRFLASYESLFGRRIEDVDIEVMAWRLHAAAARREIPSQFSRTLSAGTNKLKGERRAYFSGHGEVACGVYDRYALRAGDEIAGPAIIEERESTAIVGPEGRLHVDEYLNLVVDLSV